MGDPAAGLAAVEARLCSILEPYRDRLEEGTIYGVPMLRRPGAKAHDWFAGVQAADGYVKLNFLPMHAHPELLDGISPAPLHDRPSPSGPSASPPTNTAAGIGPNDQIRHHLRTRLVLGVGKAGAGADFASGGSRAHLPHARAAAAAGRRIRFRVGEPRLPRAVFVSGDGRNSRLPWAAPGADNQALASTPRSG